MDDVQRLNNLFNAIAQCICEDEEEIERWYAECGDQYDESMGMTPNEAIAKLDAFTKNLIKKHKK